MYRHILALIDCTDDARRAAPLIAHFVETQPSCQVTLAALMTPGAPTPEMQRARLEHAQGALKAVGDLLAREGVYTRRRVIEGEDHAAALAAEAHSLRARYDLIVLDTHQTRVEPFEPPCRGSLADQICRHVDIPVMVLPNHPPSPVEEYLLTVREELAEMKEMAAGVA